MSVPVRTWLDYEVISTPYPLATSPAVAGTPPSLANIHVVVSNGGSRPLYCRTITVSVPVGTTAQSLTPNFAGIRPGAAPADAWTFTVAQKGTLRAVSQAEEAVFVGRPTTDPQRVAENGIVLSLDNVEVNGEAGITTLHVVENVSVDGKEWTDNECWLRLVKTGLPAPTPEADLPRNFRAAQVEVPQGELATLLWEGPTNLAYRIDQAGRPRARVSDVRTWTSAPLDRTATFHLLALESESETAPVRHYLSTTVPVRGAIPGTTAFAVLAAAEFTARGDAQNTAIDYHWGFDAAPSDGFVVGHARLARRVDLLGCVMISCTVDGFTTHPYHARVTGPTVDGLSFSGESGPVFLDTVPSRVDAAGGFVAPVPQGASFTLDIAYVRRLILSGSYAFHWVPLGARGGAPVLNTQRSGPTTAQP